MSRPSAYLVSIQEVDWDPWLPQAVFTSREKADAWVAEWEREEKFAYATVSELSIDPYGWA
jgi:hypothetical protein